MFVDGNDFLKLAYKFNYGFTEKLLSHSNSQTHASSLYCYKLNEIIHLMLVKSVQ